MIRKAARTNSPRNWSALNSTHLRGSRSVSQPASGLQGTSGRKKTKSRPAWMLEVSAPSPA
jgi:hypothetical protein